MFENIKKQAVQASQSVSALSDLDDNDKVLLLNKMAEAIINQKEVILKENKKDIVFAKDAGLVDSLIDRLTLNNDRIKSMAQGLKTVADLPDPIGKVLEDKRLKNGLQLIKVSVPIGTIAIIYESRPNVTADAVGLCLKSGNAVILKGGKEAIHSNRILVKILKEVLDNFNQSDSLSDAVQFIDSTDREATKVLLQQEGFVDLVIPRGGKGLMQAVLETSKIPVLKHLNGICHVYADKAADLDMAEKIVINAKCQRPGVCNAMECLLVHVDVADKFLPKVFESLNMHKVEIFGCDKTQKILGDKVKAATEDNYKTEYLDLKLSVKVVSSLLEAIKHINTYGSQHSDAIITNNTNSAEIFMKKINSATVYHNASTRFTDGAEFDKGAEMGISTNKLHARGPVGVEELTIYKYCLFGNGNVKR